MYYDQLSALGIRLTKRSGSEKTQCPKCHDNRSVKNKHKKDLSVNITTGEYCCHNTPCDFKGNVRAREQKEKKVYVLPDQNMVTQFKISKAVEQYMHDKRGISPAVLKKFMIYAKQEWMPQSEGKETCICFPYFMDGKLVNVKFRSAKKNFKMIKDAMLTLYGINHLGQRKHVIITEGEIDALTFAECGYGTEIRELINKDTGEVTEENVLEQHHKWCPTSVPNGTSDKGQLQMEYLDNCFDHLIGIHEFIIVTDDDKAGHVLKEELIRRLGVERCRTVVYPQDEVVELEGGIKRKCKDINEVKLWLGEEAVHKMIANAKFVPIEGVYYLEDLYPKMFERFKQGLMIAPTTRMGADFDKHFRWKKGNLNLGVGYGNWGKTTFQNQLELTKSIYDGWKWACFCPENYPADDFYEDLFEPFIGKPLTDFTDEEYFLASEFVKRHFFFVYPEDDQTLDNVLERFRNLVMKKGIDGGRIDPWNQLDKFFGPYQMTSEERLSTDLKKAKRFALLNSICLNILAHPKNPDYLNKDKKQLPVVDMYDIAGGAQWGNKIDDIWSYYLPNFHLDKNDPAVDVHFQKIKRTRTGGQRGVVSMMFNRYTKRYTMNDGFIPCDPKIAERIIREENFDQGIQTKIFDTDLSQDVEAEDDLPF